MFNLNASIKSFEEEGDELKIRGLASTPSTDRAKDIILVDAWSKGGVDNYVKNPILLFNHDYNEPIGKVTSINTTNKGLEVEGVIFPETKAYNLVKKGVLKTFSVGFLINDADYDKEIDGLIIKDAELLEISVVSVPCNQDAVFELSKSISSDKYEKMKEKFGKEADKDADASKSNKMTTEELNEAIAKALEGQAEANAKAVADAVKAEREEAQKAAAEAKAAAEEEALREEAALKAAEAVSKSVAEQVEAKVKEALESSATEESMKDLKEALEAQKEQLKSLQESRGGFFPDKSEGRSKWIEDSELKNEATEAFIFAKAMQKPIEETSIGKGLLEKVNTQSSVQVSSDKFEQDIALGIERDIEQELILKPLFREMNLTSASQVLTIAPDTGYATHQTSGSTAPGVKPNGLLNNADGSQPYALSEVQFRTDKLISNAFLAKDTDEDVIIPLLPIIREAMVRQHAKSVDQMILSAGVAGGIYPNMVSKGLLAYANTSGRSVNGPSVGASEKVTGQALLSARQGMGKYGLNPADIVYIVSTSAYYQLLNDEAFYNNDEVGTGTKVRGEIGRMFGSPIMVSSEMGDTVAAGEVAAIALNRRNFLMPRLRGYTFESEYSVPGQHWQMVTTQRLGFTEMIPDAPSVVALKYAA